MTIHFGKWAVLIIERPSLWFWDWGITRPKYQNWARLVIDFPCGWFAVHGWLFWGEVK